MRALAVDDRGRVAAAGIFFDGGRWFYALQSLDEHGEVIFDVRPVLDNGEASAVAFDGAGNIVSAGEVHPECGAACPEENLVVRKTSPTGKELWVTTYDGFAESGDWATAVVGDGAGNIYVGGTTTVLMEGGPEGSRNLDTAAFLRKLDAAGREQWTRTCDSDQKLGFDLVHELVVDPDGGVAAVISAHESVVARRYDAKARCAGRCPIAAG